MYAFASEVHAEAPLMSSAQRWRQSVVWAPQSPFRLQIVAQASSTLCLEDDGGGAGGRPTDDDGAGAGDGDGDGDAEGDGATLPPLEPEFGVLGSSEIFPPHAARTMEMGRVETNAALRMGRLPSPMAGTTEIRHARLRRHVGVR
jgi:hypothetical protein